MTERTARTPHGMKLLVELAETLQSPVSSLERMDFPNRHPLAGTGGAGYRAGRDSEPRSERCLERGAGGAGARTRRPSASTSIDLSHKSNIQDFGHYPEVDLDIGADAEATLPALIEACKKLITADRKRAHAGARREAGGGAQGRPATRNIELAAVGWDASPVSLARLCAELWPLIKNEDWSLVSWQGFISDWPGKLWNFDKHYQYIGGQGAGGMGYGAPAAVGAALANKKHGRLSVSDPDRRRSELRAGRVVDGGASSDPAADDHAQQPRLSPGSHVHRAGRRASATAARTVRTSARSSGIPISITRKWRRPTGMYGKGRSRIRTIWRRRSSARSNW